jgi:hypothetical protein
MRRSQKVRKHGTLAKLFFTKNEILQFKTLNALINKDISNQRIIHAEIKRGPNTIHEQQLERQILHQRGKAAKNHIAQPRPLLLTTKQRPR